MERTFHAPRLRFGVERSVRFGALPLAIVDPTSAEIRALLAELSAGSPRPPDALAARARALGAAARRFLDPADGFRRRALEALPSVTGFSRSMVEEALPRVFGPLSEDSLAAIAGRMRGAAVPVLGIVAAGNIPGVALPQLALAITAGSSCIVKTAAGEPLLAALFAEALSEIDDELGAALAIVWWRGGSAACESDLARGVDSLVVYGSDEAITAWSARAPRRLVAHGHRASIAVVRLEDGAADLAALAEDAALDVALYDQLGCLSPQCMFAIGGDEARRRSFVDRLGEALDRLDRRIPRGAVPEDHLLAIRRLQDEYEWREIRGDRVRLVKGREPARWTIAEDSTADFRPSPLYRTVLVRHLEHAKDLPQALGGWLPRIESAGIGPWPDPDVSHVLAGIPRQVRLGCMQSPDLAWRQGGLDPMAAIIDGGSGGESDGGSA